MSRSAFPRSASAKTIREASPLACGNIEFRGGTQIEVGGNAAISAGGHFLLEARSDHDGSGQSIIAERRDTLGVDVAL